MNGITLKFARTSGGDVGYECLLSLAGGVCIAAIIGWLF